MGRLYDQIKRDLELRNFSPHTRRVYLACVRRFVLYFHRSPEELGDPEIREYLHYLIQQRNVSQGAVTQAYGALKFFYETTLKRDWEGFRIPKGKTGRKLPVVLSQQEVEALFGAIKNLKHQSPSPEALGYRQSADDDPGGTREREQRSVYVIGQAQLGYSTGVLEEVSTPGLAVL